MKKYILYNLLLILVAHANAQTVHSDIALMDYERLAQLQDSVNAPTRSFVIRSASQFWSNTLNKPFTAKSKPLAQLVQAGYTMQNNNNLSIGYNDGNMLPAVGLQQRVTLGAYFQWQGFSLQLQPEFVSAANADPVSFTSDPADGNYWAKIYLYNENKIDNFNRFGTAPISKVFAGQSSLRFNTNNISLGISTENLWWGPGIRNSLVLTNNAPGFLHATVNSRKPIPTKWGNIEFQAVVGNLKNADTEAPDNALMRTIWADGILRKSQEQRTMLGYIFSWNPKWTPNLHIGLTGANYFYTAVVTPSPSVLITAAENKSGSASLGAVFFRYVMPKEQAEVYVEYGRANKLVTPLNIFGDTIPTGYTAGFRKLFLSSSPGQGRSPLGGRGRSSARGGILLSVEITQLQLPDSRLIFNKENVFGIPKTNSWYTHPFVTQGYTNEGQVMGASIGPGSNSQTINISWVKGLKRIGFQAERLAHNNDFYYYNYFSGIVGTGQANKYWVDWNVGLQFQWDIKNVLISGFYNHTSALNYRWTKLDGGFAGPSEMSDKTNKQFSLSLTYFFTTSPLRGTPPERRRALKP